MVPVIFMAEALGFWLQFILALLLPCHCLKTVFITWPASEDAYSSQFKVFCFNPMPFMALEMSKLTAILNKTYCMLPTQEALNSRLSVAQDEFVCKKKWVWCGEFSQLGEFHNTAFLATFKNGFQWKPSEMSIMLLPKITSPDSVVCILPRTPNASICSNRQCLPDLHSLIITQWKVR